MKEISIAPKDLVDMDAQTYNEIRSHGRNVSEVKQAMQKPKEQESLNINVAFVAPKKQNYSRQQVFLPNSNQRYDMNQFSQEIKSMGLKNQFTNVRSIPQTYVQSIPQVQYQNSYSYVQTPPSNVQYQQTSQT